MVPLSTCSDHSGKTGTAIPTIHPVKSQTKVLPKALSMQLPWTAYKATYPDKRNVKWLDPLLDHYSHITKDS